MSTKRDQPNQPEEEFTGNSGCWVALFLIVLIVIIFLLFVWFFVKTNTGVSILSVIL